MDSTPADTIYITHTHKQTCVHTHTHTHMPHSKSFIEKAGRALYIVLIIKPQTTT